MAPRLPIWAMRDERNDEAVVASAITERIAADTIAAVDKHIAAASAAAAGTVAAASAAADGTVAAAPPPCYGSCSLHP